MADDAPDDRLLARDALANSAEAHLAALVESSDDAIFSRTLDGIVLSWNTGAERLFGYTAQEMVGRPVSMLVPPDVALTVPALLERIREGECIRQHEILCLRKDGNTVSVLLTISPVRGRDGHIVGASTVAHDITERKRVQAALTESEAEYRSTFDEAPVGIAHTSLTGRWLRVNERLRLLLGYSHEQLHATDFAALTHPEDVEHNTDARDRLVAGEITHYAREKRYRRVDGVYVWVHLTVSLHRDTAGEPKYFIVVVEDVSELKQAQQELDHIFNLSPDMICTSDYHGYFLRTNATWTQVLGYSAEQLQGRPFLTFVHPDDRAATVAEFTRLTQGQATFGFTNRFRTSGGAYRWIEWHGKADQAAQVIYAVARDQTGRRLLEEQLRQAQKMDAVGQLAGGIAHDFNNLLTAILGFAEMTIAQLPPADPMRDDVQQILNAGQSAASLTQQLLAFSRKQMLDPQILDLNALVDGMQTLLRRVIGEDVDLVTMLGERISRIKADRGQLEQVIMNLAVNARDAMPSGGTLRITTQTVDLDDAFVAAHRGATRGPHVRLTLSDTGTGMDPEVLAHLFEPFFTTKERGKGTGLGLATVYGIVKQSGGYISVESAQAEGTSFLINFPSVSIAPGIVVATETPARAVSGTETILLVEDQQEVRDVVRQALQRHGYDVLEAADGQAALVLLANRHSPIHLLLTDVVMPNMSGRELVDRITQHDKSIRVLYTSGYTDDAIVRHGVLDPGIDFLQKPFTPDQLLAKVRDVLDRPGPR
jgi:PAS domain S-box-containing protein